MLYPSINEIKHKADSRYTLVILAAKRARDIVDGKPPLISCKVNRPVSIAAREINEDMIKVRYPEDKPAEELEEASDEAVGEAAEAADAEAAEEAVAEAAEEAETEAEADEEAHEETAEAAEESEKPEEGSSEDAEAEE